MVQPHTKEIPMPSTVPEKTFLDDDFESYRPFGLYLGPYGQTRLWIAPEPKGMKYAIIGTREYTLNFTPTSAGTALHYRLRQPSPQI